MSASGAISQLKSAALAALIAALIWVFAEGESVTSRTVVASVVFPAEPVGDVVIRPANPNFRGTVRVTLEGSTRMLDLVGNTVAEEIRLKPGSPGVPDAPGQQSVDLREAIASNSRLSELGGTVANVEPRLVIVNVIRLVSREVPVRVELGADVSLEAEPVVTPATVTVRVPASEAGRMGESAAAVAVVSESDLRRLRGDGVQTVQAFVRAPDQAAGVESFITPDRVAVSLRPRRKVDSMKLDRVPVWVGMPSGRGTEWNVDVQDTELTDVVLTGPVEELQSIRSGQTPVHALIELSAEDLEKGVQSKTPTFPGLPKGVNAAANVVRIRAISRRGPNAVP